jgi:hypothetical protein
MTAAVSAKCLPNIENFLKGPFQIGSGKQGAERPRISMKEMNSRWLER